MRVIGIKRFEGWRKVTAEQVTGSQLPDARQITATSFDTYASDSI